MPRATHAPRNFGFLSIVQGPISVAPCQNPYNKRFATFSSVYREGFRSSRYSLSLSLSLPTRTGSGSMAATGGVRATNGASPPKPRRSAAGGAESSAHSESLGGAAAAAPSQKLRAAMGSSPVLCARRRAALGFAAAEVRFAEEAALGGESACSYVSEGNHTHLGPSWAGCLPTTGFSAEVLVQGSSRQLRKYEWVQPGIADKEVVGRSPGLRLWGGGGRRE